ncbi:MAG: OmpA family protein [Cocleimonas sp.]|nr:OmpA family protein [Cocleimonas sp.]
MSKDKDSTTLQEYFISGIVILFFGLLYLFLSNDFNVGSSKDNLLPTLFVAQTAPPNSLADRLSANDLDEPENQDDNNRKKADASSTKDSSETALKSPTQANAIPPKDPASQQVATMDASDKEVQEPQQPTSVEINPTPAAIEESEPKSQFQPQVDPEPTTPSDGGVRLDDTKANDAKAEEETDVTSQDPDGLIYKLPNGKTVEIAKNGFENNLKQAINNGDVGKPIIFDRVYFDSGSSKLKKQSDYQIQATAALLNTHKEINIAIRGHSDNKGSPKNNSILSLLRGGSMKKALTDLGIDPSRIQIEGLADQEPVASNKTKRGRRNNRRIDLVIKGKS